MKSLFIMLVLLAACLLAEARLVRWWSPKELCEKSDFVIIATPVAIEQTTEHGVIRMDGLGTTYPSIGYVAKLKVNNVICTAKEEQLPEDIIFRYSNIDFTRYTQGIVDGPLRFNLDPNVQYIVYLKKDPKHEGEYVGALEDEIDDWQTVIRLMPPEKPKVAQPAAEGTKPR